MNELIFLLHILVMVAAALGALKLGKEGLMSLTALQATLANFFVLKQMILFGWTVTCSDVFIVGITLNLNLLQEYFGKESAQKTIWISFSAMLFFGIVAQMHLLYAPALSDTAHIHYLALLKATPRLLSASLLSFFVVQQVDVRVFAFLKKTYPAWGWSSRNLITLVNSQLLDTLLFSFVGLYGIVSSLQDVILLSFLVKVIVIVSMTLFSHFSKRFIRHEV